MAVTQPVEAETPTAAGTPPPSAQQAASMTGQDAPASPAGPASAAPADDQAPPTPAQKEEQLQSAAPDTAEAAPAAAAAAATPPEDEEMNEIIVTARPRFAPGDPLLALNAQSYAVIQSVDRAFVGPAAMTYKDKVPRPVRSGFRNFMNNLQEPVVFVNYLLQLKVGKAAETVGRFAVNTTLGIGGLFDTAKKHPFNLPHRNNGFAYTLGFYGVKPGPFLFLPLIGPTTLRDVFGRLVDLSVLPFAFGKPFNDPLYAIPTTVIRLLDERAESDEDLRAIAEESGDPYTATKENYLRQRQAEIDALRGRSTAPENGAAPVLISPLRDMTPENLRPMAPETAAPEAPAAGIVLPDVPVMNAWPHQRPPAKITEDPAPQH